MAELRTTADELMKLVRERKKMTVQEAGKQLGVPEKTVQSWVDFLVEEHILGIEYKFTTPYIYVHSEERLDAAREEEKHYTLKDFKDVFYQYAQDKEMPNEKLPALWKQHLKYLVVSQKQFFIDECRRREMKEGEALFAEYHEELLNGA